MRGRRSLGNRQCILRASPERGLPIAYYAAKYNVDIDVLTRGAGFGYIGSTITSLIYASFTFIFFALEAAITSVINLSLYSPDFNPIEQWWLQLKAFLRQFSPTTATMVDKVVSTALDLEILNICEIGLLIAATVLHEAEKCCM